MKLQSWVLHHKIKQPAVNCRNYLWNSLKQWKLDDSASPRWPELRLSLISRHQLNFDKILTGVWRGERFRRRRGRSSIYRRRNRDSEGAAEVRARIFHGNGGSVSILSRYRRDSRWGRENGEGLARFLTEALNGDNHPPTAATRRTFSRWLPRLCVEPRALAWRFWSKFDKKFKIKKDNSI